MKKSIFRNVISVALLTALAACSNESANPNPTDTKLAGTVRLLTHDSFVLSDGLVDAFEAETGLKLEIIQTGDAGSMVASAILASGNPVADVIFGVDNTLLGKALNANIFEPYTSPSATQLLPEISDPANGFVTPIDYGDVCVNIDDKYFESRAQESPQNLSDLVKPEFKNMFVFEDPAASSPGLAFMLATRAAFGDDWLSYWSSLKANGAKSASSWTDAYFTDFSFSGGDRPLVVSYASSPPAEIVYAEEPKPTTVSTSAMTAGCFRQIEYAAVLKGAANPVAAKAVIDWLLSPQVQADIPLSMFVFPSVSNTPLPEVFTKFAGIVNEPLTLSADEIAENSQAWLAEWDANWNS